MNLGKLLGAGKSFVSGRNSAAYRADKRVYLPQFISPKNPFANSAPASTPGEAPKSSSENFVGVAKKTATPWFKSQTVVAPKQAIAPAGPVRATAWVGKFNPVSIFRSAPAAPDKFAPAVQAELSLEKVKVVHNDLTDADVEVVPMKSRPAREPAAVPSVKKSWSDLSERIMKATAL